MSKAPPASEKAMPVKWKSMGAAPRSAKIIALGRAPWDQGPRDAELYLALVRYNRKDRCWFIAGTRMLFFPVKWIPAA